MAKALIELNANRPQVALELLDRAVAADPSDISARYQRGAARARLGDYEGAVGDLMAVLTAQPDFPAAALELGAALIETGRYDRAVAPLQLAQADPALDAQASFFLGLANLRLDRLDEAKAAFERAAARDPALSTQSGYYLGVIAYRQRDYAAAEQRFTAVERTMPLTTMGRESGRFLDLIRRTGRDNYRAFGTLALEYDSNVNLASVAPSDPDVSGEADGRFVINAGGQFVPWSGGPASLVLSYEFYQSLQFELTDFNLMDNRPAVQLVFDFDWVQFGIQGRYDYYLRETDSFLHEGTGFTWATVREPGIGYTDVFFRLQRRDYEQPEFAGLNGFYNYAGVRQFIELPGKGRLLWFGYQLGFNSITADPTQEFPEPDAFEYGSQQFEVALRWPLPYLITGESGFRYEYQGYNAASALFAPTKNGRRQDNDYRVVVAFERQLPELNEHLYANAAWFGTFNDSNKADFEYNRQIGSVGMTVRF